MPNSKDSHLIMVILYNTSHFSVLYDDKNDLQKLWENYYSSMLHSLCGLIIECHSQILTTTGPRLGEFVET